MISAHSLPVYRFLGLIGILMVIVTTGCERPIPIGGVPSIQYGALPGEGSAGVHTVNSGETIWMIAQRYRLPLRDILDLNDLRPPYALNDVTRIRLPAPRQYTAQPGDTWLGVARLFDLSAADLRAQNQARGPLQAGQVIRLSRPMTGPLVGVPYLRAESPTESLGQVRPMPSLRPQSIPATTLAREEPMSLPMGTGRFIRPVDGAVFSTFGPKENGLTNDGINIRAVRGTPVRAAQTGEVAYTGSDLKALGTMILIRHQGGYITAYAHLDRSLVTRGQRVSAGETIGTVGSSGIADTPQLHFEIRRGATPVDPALYI